jgi:Spy/CpxP family protein refolding chaperone
MKTLLRMMLSTALVVVFVANVSAQGRPGGGGGFGMMGGRGGMSAYGMLAMSKPLQEELKLSEEQVKKIEEAMKPINEKMREAFGGGGRPGGGGQRPSEEEMKKRADAMKAIADDTKKAVESAIKPEQSKRLSQINYQMMGTAAFSDEGVQKELKVTDSQKDKIKSISDELREDTMKIFQNGPRLQFGQQPSEEDRKKMEENTKKTTALAKEAADKIDELMTDEQKKQWKEMIGEKVDTAKFRPQFGGQRPRRDN